MTRQWTGPFVVVAIVTTTTLVGMLSALGGLPARSAPSMLDRQAEKYVELVAALAAVSETSEVEGTRAGPATTHTLSVVEIATQAQAALDIVKATSAGPTARRQHLIAQLTALGAHATQIATGRLTWQEELRQTFQLDATAVAGDGRPGDAANALERALPGSGSPAQRLVDYERRFLVPEDRLPVVFERALGECRERTKAHIAFPGGEAVSVNYVRNAPWSGFSRYLGTGISQIDVNLSFPLSVDRVLDLACHEGYPGHHAFNTLRDKAWPREWPERDVAPMNSPDAFIGEATASWASDLVFSDPERLAFERDTLFPAAGLDPADATLYVQIARLTGELRRPLGVAIARYLAGELDVVEAGWALQRDAMMAHPTATLQFVNQSRGYALAYTLGREQLAALLGPRVPEATRWENYRRLATLGISASAVQ